MTAVALPATPTLGELAAAAGGRLLSGHAARPAAGISIDTRTLRAGELFVAVAGPRFDGHDFLAEAAAKGAAAAMVARDVLAPPGLDVVKVDDTSRALGDLARHLRLAAGLPVVAVTGSTGKTTTKEMAARLLEDLGPVLKTEGNLNNRFGVPLTLFRLRPEHAAAVVELGMSAPGEIARLTRIARPDVAVITNVAAAHLAFFESLDAIAAAKAEILEGLRPFGAAVLNWDDERTRRIGQQHRGDVLWFGRDRMCDVSAENVRGSLNGTRFDLRVQGRSHEVALPLPGMHFVANFLAAAAAAVRLGVAPERIAEHAGTLSPAQRRGQLLRLRDGISLLDDSYNSNPAAVAAALAALALAGPARRVAFLGDMLELGPESPRLHREAGELAGRGVELLVGVGPEAGELLEGAARAGLAPGARRHFPDSTAAAAAAPDLVRPGDAVLVKGSRGVRMETVVDALLARFGRLEA